jgi:truncated hemoglobin YjbI
MENVTDDDREIGTSVNADSLADWERALLRPAGEETPPLAPHIISSLLEEGAKELSGISLERAKALDDINLVKKCGEVAFIRLAESFVSQAFDNLTLGPMFAGIEQDEMTQSLYEYFIQRFGGRPYFTERKGTVSLFRRHRHVTINETTCDVWLRIMGGCLENLVPSVFDSKSARILMDHLRYTCGALMAYHRDARALLQRDLGDLYQSEGTAYDNQNIYA